MFIEGNAIIDFDYLDTAVQGEVLKCFVGKEESILFPYDERNFTNEFVKEWSQFVRERTVYVGDNPIAIPWGSNTLTHWYEAKSEDDVHRILEHEGITYWCCIAPIGANIKHDYTFVLFAYEHTQYHDEEVRALWVYEREDGRFQKSVVPRLMQLPCVTAERIRYTCPCCGYKLLDDPSDDVCPICFWEDDHSQLEDPDSLGANTRVTLRQAQKNFVAYGACEEVAIPDVRKPTEFDEKDPNWHPLD